MSPLGSDQQRKLEAYFGNRQATHDSDESSMSTAVPLLSPSNSIRPRAVTFMSPPKPKGFEEVMFRESPVSECSRLRTSNKSVASSYDIFFSPSSQVSSLHGSIASPSPVTMKASRNYTDHADIERFRLDNISNCQSPRELQQMIAQLQAHGRYPLLVQKAQKRLYQVQQSSACPLIQEEEEEVNEIMVHVTPKSATVNSLVYSYDEERDAPSPEHLFTTKQSVQLHHQSYSAEQEREYKLNIQKLNQKIAELDEALARDKHEFERQLQEIKRAKQQSDLTSQKLKQSLVTSHQTNNQMALRIQALEAEHQEITLKMEAERAAQETYRQKAAQQEATLQQKINNLLQEIQSLQRTGGKAHELKELLKCAQMRLENVTKERNSMIETILRSMGKDTSKSEVKKMTDGDRAAVVKALETHTKNSKSAIQAMQEALNKSQGERRKLEKSSVECNMRLTSALAEKERLENDNTTLEERIQQLSKDLADSRVHFNELVRQTKEDCNKEFKKREMMFKNTIRILQKRNNNSVSSEVHAQVVQQAENLQKEIDNLREQSGATTKNEVKSQALQAVPAPIRTGNTLFRPVTNRNINLKSAQPRLDGYFKPSNVMEKSTNGTSRNEFLPVSSKPQVLVRTRSSYENNQNKHAAVPPPPPPPPALVKKGSPNANQHTNHQVRTISTSTNGSFPFANSSKSKAIVKTTASYENDENKHPPVPPPPHPAVGKNPLGNHKANQNINHQVAKVAWKGLSSPADLRPCGVPSEGSAGPPSALQQGKTPSKSRCELVRESGGLRGMIEKMKKVRSPTFN